MLPVLNQHGAVDVNKAESKYNCEHSELSQPMPYKQLNHNSDKARPVL